MYAVSFWGYEANFARGWNQELWGKIETLKDWGQITWPQHHSSLVALTSLAPKTATMLVGLFYSSQDSCGTNDCREYSKRSYQYWTDRNVQDIQWHHYYQLQSSHQQNLHLYNKNNTQSVHISEKYASQNYWYENHKKRLHLKTCWRM